MLSVHKPLFPPANEKIHKLVVNNITEERHLRELYVRQGGVSLDFASLTSHDHLVIEISSKSKMIFYWLEWTIKECGGFRLEMDEAMRWIYRGLTPHQAVIKTLARQERTSKIIASKARKRKR